MFLGFSCKYFKTKKILTVKKTLQLATSLNILCFKPLYVYFGKGFKMKDI